MSEWLRGWLFTRERRRRELAERVVTPVALPESRTYRDAPPVTRSGTTTSEPA